MNRTWPAILISISSVLSFALDTPGRGARPAVIEQRERQFLTRMVRSSQFLDVHHISSRPSCQDVQPPEALTTPDPLFTTSAFGRRVKVSFIIGLDGRVHSPLILESAGMAGDRRVLQTVRTWRYRPATCNGVPTETEGKVEFSSR
jgi:TonB family protein